MKIVWAKSAIADLEALRTYIARDSEHYAARFAQRIVKSVQVLKKFPELGQVVPDFDDRVVRERLVQNWRVLYEVRGDRVNVLSVVHAARDRGSVTL